MPYSPQTEFRGDRYLFQGLSGAGDKLADGVQQLQKTRQETDFLTGMGDYYFGKQPEEHQKFLAGSLGAKRGMVTAAQAQEHAQRQDFNQQMQMKQYYLNEWEAGERSLDRYWDVERREKEAKNKPVIATRRDPNDPGKTIVSNSHGTFQVVPDELDTTQQPDGEIAKDAAGNELGVYVAGKLVPDKYVSKWDPNSLGQVLINTRTGNPKGGPAVQTNGLPAGGANTPGGTGAQANNPSLPQQVSTAEDYARLKPGDKYLDPQGNLRTKK